MHVFWVLASEFGVAVKIESESLFAAQQVWDMLSTRCALSARPE